MHGYIGDHADMDGFAIAWSSTQQNPRCIARCDLIDICPTLCHSLSLDAPKDNQGGNLFG